MSYQERQGLTRLNTGDSFTRTNHSEMLVTKDGDTAVVSNSGVPELQVHGPGARCEILDRQTGKFKPHNEKMDFL